MQQKNNENGKGIQLRKQLDALNKIGAKPSTIKAWLSAVRQGLARRRIENRIARDAAEFLQRNFRIIQKRG